MKILVLALTITVALGEGELIKPKLHYRSKKPIAKFVLRIIPELNQEGEVIIPVNPDSAREPELISPKEYGADEPYGEVWDAANDGESRWSVTRIDDHTIQYVVDTETNDIASTSFTEPRNADDFKLFMELPLEVTLAGAEIIGEPRVFCIDVNSEFYVKDDSGNLVKTNFNLVDENVPGLVDPTTGEPLTGPPTETFCARYFEVHDIPRGSDEGDEGDASADDDNDDDDGKGGGSSDSADDDDYIKNPTASPTTSPTPSPTPSPTEAGTEAGTPSPTSDIPVLPDE